MSRRGFHDIHEAGMVAAVAAVVACVAFWANWRWVGVGAAIVAAAFWLLDLAILFKRN